MDYPTRSFNNSATCYPRLASFCEGLSPTCTPYDRLESKLLSTSISSPNPLEDPMTLKVRLDLARSPELLRVDATPKPLNLSYRPLFLVDSIPPRSSDFQLHPVYCSPFLDAISRADLYQGISSDPTKPHEPSFSRRKSSGMHSSIVPKSRPQSFTLNLCDILDDSLLEETDFIADMEEALANPDNDQVIPQASPRFPLYSHAGAVTPKTNHGYSWKEFGTGSDTANISDVLLVESGNRTMDGLCLIDYASTLERQDEKAIFVRPQDTIGELPPSIEELHVKSEEQEDTDVDCMDFVYPQDIVPQAENMTFASGEPHAPNLTADQLCEVVDYFFQHIHVPKVEASELPIKHRATVLDDDNQLLPWERLPLLDNSQVLETVSASPTGQNSTNTRMILSDRTNCSRTRPLHSILEGFDNIVPADITLERPYEGVTHEAVAQKTKYFQMMNPGLKLSDDLLFNFAGRLSVCGDPVLGYRCYITGCRKTTKRKDHMGDHIRTHLGEKPFQCSICGLGFIRNNDCQRHENNHRPDKKFICDCQAAFSRRDLFVRHQKTACQLLARKTSGKRRVRNRAKQGTPDGDALDDFDYVPGSSVSSWKKRSY